VEEFVFTGCYLTFVAGVCTVMLPVYGTAKLISKLTQSSPSYSIYHIC